MAGKGSAGASSSGAEPASGCRSAPGSREKPIRSGQTPFLNPLQAAQPPLCLPPAPGVMKSRVEARQSPPRHSGSAAGAELPFPDPNRVARRPLPEPEFLKFARLFQQTKCHVLNGRGRFCLADLFFISDLEKKKKKKARLAWILHFQEPRHY